MNRFSRGTTISDPALGSIAGCGGEGPPVAGAWISTLRGLSLRKGPSGLGRISCFAVRKSERGRAGYVLLSNHHVLCGHGGRAGDVVYQLAIDALAEVLSLRCQHVNPIGIVEEEGQDGPHSFGYRDESLREFHIDCATARLASEAWRPAGRAAFAMVARAHPLDVLPNRRLPVRLLGVHDRPAGRIIDVAATVARADGRLCPNSMVIETLPGRPPFAGTGDSGALVVDGFGRAVGLLWGVDLARPDLAYACHIHPVLDRLGLVLSRRG